VSLCAEPPLSLPNAQPQSTSEKASLVLDVGFRNRLARERRVVVRGHGVLGTKTIQSAISYFLAKEEQPIGTKEQKAQRALLGKSHTSPFVKRAENPESGPGGP